MKLRQPKIPRLSFALVSSPSVARRLWLAGPGSLVIRQLPQPVFARFFNPFSRRPDVSSARPLRVARRQLQSASPPLHSRRAPGLFPPRAGTGSPRRPTASPRGDLVSPWARSIFAARQKPFAARKLRVAARRIHPAAAFFRPKPRKPPQTVGFHPARPAANGGRNWARPPERRAATGLSSTDGCGPPFLWLGSRRASITPKAGCQPAPRQNKNCLVPTRSPNPKLSMLATARHWAAALTHKRNGRQRSAAKASRTVANAGLGWLARSKSNG